MANKFKSQRRTRLYCCATALTLTASSFTPNLYAGSFSIGEIEGTFSSQLSIGNSWRVESQDTKFISSGNGGTGVSTTADDGNNNFKRGDTFSRIFKGNHDLELTYQNYGAFFRGKYWYDFELEDNDRPHGHIANNYSANTPLNDDQFSKTAQFSGVLLLDAFVYGSFDVNEMPLDLRLGSQVVSWGESTFIRGGINSINPVDVSAFRRPGAEIKEGLLPVPMLYGSLGLTDNLSLEGFYQLQWKKTEIEGCGTYFSTVDWAADGCNGLAYAASVPDATNILIDAVGERRRDRDASDSGQFGLAARYYSEKLDTEFGVYYLNYHSRVPFVSAYRTTTNFPATRNLLTNAVESAEYGVFFPEDIELYGLSAATNVGNWALSGEISYRPNLPIQINGNDLLVATLFDGSSGLSPLDEALRNIALGDELRGTRDFKVTQAQATAVGFFDQVLGASRITVIGEVGTSFVHDLDDELRYGRNTIFGIAPAGDNDGFTTDFSWGYRLRTSFDYPNAFAGIDLRPVISFSHDIEGHSPSPGAQFNEGRKTLGIALNFDYISKYNASISYTRFFGGEFDETSDRDFIALSAGITF